MLEGDFADMWTEFFFAFVDWGPIRRVKHAQTWERGPPSVLTEIYINEVSIQKFHTPSFQNLDIADIQSSSQ